VRIVILGAGSVGTQLARRLTDEGKDVVLIEKDPDTARVAANSLDCLVVQGDGSLPEILEKTGLSKASHFIALTGSDEVNMVTCSVVAAEYAKVRRTARVRNPYFSKLAPSRHSFMGVDRFVNPDIETARAFLSLVTRGGDEDIVRFEDERLELRSSRIAPNSPLCGRSMKESRATIKRGFLAAALERNREGAEPEVPSGDTIPEVGDSIYLLGAPEDLDAILGRPEAHRDRARKVVITGGGPIGRFVAEGLSGIGDDLGLLGAVNRFLRSGGKASDRCPRREVVIIERDMALCKILARDLPGVLVLNREIGEEDIFQEEGLERADVFLALDRHQEENLLSAARAKAFGIPRTLALAENNTYLPLVARLGIDSVLSVRSNVVASIIEYLRGGSLTTLHSFFDRGLKILEFTVQQGKKPSGLALKELKLQRGALVIYVNREGHSSLPTGETRLEGGDRIGIFTNMEAIRSVEELFLGEGA